MTNPLCAEVHKRELCLNLVSFVMANGLCAEGFIFLHFNSHEHNIRHSISRLLFTEVSHSLIH